MSSDLAYFEEGKEVEAAKIYLDGEVPAAGFILTEGNGVSDISDVVESSNSDIVSTGVTYDPERDRVYDVVFVHYETAGNVTEGLRDYGFENCRTVTPDMAEEIAVKPGRYRRAKA